MSTVKEWMEEMEGIDGERCAELAGAIEKLMSWELFRKEFGWTRINELGMMLRKEADMKLPRWAIRAIRSHLSHLGLAETWCMRHGEVELFSTEEEAQAQADEYNVHAGSNVSYTVREYRHW